MVFGEEKMTMYRKGVCMYVVKAQRNASAWNKLVVDFKGCIARALVTLWVD